MNNSNKIQPFQKIKHLRQFYTPNNKLFQDAQILPQFFQTNLVDDARVVKYLHNDPQANIRVFYYQYLKLCFEIDNVDYQSYIEKIYQLIRTEGFEFYFQSNDHQKEIKNAQYKSLLVDFFEIMNSGSMTVDTVLNQYPILDDVFTNFFRTVVMLASVATQYNEYINKNQLFDFLSSFFSVDISSYDKCLKFIQSDIFVYEQDPQNIYMAFIRDQEQEVHQSYQVLSSQQKNKSSVSNSQQFPPQAFEKTQQKLKSSIQKTDGKLDSILTTKPNSLQPKIKTIIKESYVEGQFADYTSSANITSFGNDAVNYDENQNNSKINEEKYQIQVNMNAKVQQSKHEDSEISYKNQSQEANNVVINVKTAQSEHSYEQNQKDKLAQNQRTLTTQVKNPVKGLIHMDAHHMIQSFYQQGQSALIPDLDHSQQRSENQNNSYKNTKKTVSYINVQPTKDPGFNIKQEDQYQNQQANLASRNVPNFSEQSVSKKLQDSGYNKLIILNESNIQSSNKETTGYKLNDVVKQQAQSVIHHNLNQQSLFHRPQKITPTFLPQNIVTISRQISSSNSNKQSYLSSNLHNKPQAQYEKPVSQYSNPNNEYKKPVSQYDKPSAYQTPNFKLKLNVTKQFTDSIVMKSMKQPHKSNVYQIRQRARQFRKNICQNIYYQGVEQFQQQNVKKSQNKLQSQSIVQIKSKQNIIHQYESFSTIGKSNQQIQLLQNNRAQSKKSINYDTPSSNFDSNQFISSNNHQNQLAAKSTTSQQNSMKNIGTGIGLEKQTSSIGSNKLISNNNNSYYHQNQKIMNQYQGAISQNTQTVRPSTNHYHQQQQSTYNNQNPYSMNNLNNNNNYQSYQAHQAQKISHNYSNVPAYHRITSSNSSNSNPNPQQYYQQQQPNKGFENYRPNNNIPNYISPPHRR